MSLMELLDYREFLECFEARDEYLKPKSLSPVDQGDHFVPLFWFDGAQLSVPPFTLDQLFPPLQILWLDLVVQQDPVIDYLLVQVA